MKKKENVYLYTRVSTAIQTEGYSLEAQREKMINYCKYRDFNVVGEYSDAGFSGKNIAGRKQFQQMLEDISNKKDDVKYVLVFKLSRFGRNAADVLSSLQFMQDYGVNLICVEDNIDSSAGSGKVLISVMSAIAEIERENILVQTMAGRKQKAAQGGWNGGFAPYGYDLVNGQLIVQEDEAAAVREMYDLYAHTAYGPSVIAKEINKKYKKIPRANGHLTKFTMNNVKDILDNPVYMGKIAFGRHTTEKIEGKRNEFHIVKQKDESKVIIADGTHQPIVSEELWNEVHEKRLANAKTKEKIDMEHDYYLSGLVKCPSCGCSMYGIHNGRKKKKDGTYYPMSYSYACRAASVELGVECPDPKNYSENRLMEAVTAIIKQLVNDKNFEKMVDVSIGMKADINVLEQEKAERQKELQRLNRLITQLENQLDTLDYSSKASALKEKSLNTRLDRALEDAADCQGLLDDVEERMSKIVETEATKKMIYDFLESFDVMFDVLSSSDKKDLLKMMIEKIELYPRDNRSGQWIKTIHFKFPMYYNDDDTCSTEIHFDKDGVFQPKERIVDTLQILKEAGVTKISIGIQSFQEKYQHILGRKTVDPAALSAALEAVPFETVSMDFIFALPEQTYEDLKQDIDMAFTSGANHIAIYPFIDFTFTKSPVKAMKKKEKRVLLDATTRYCQDKGYSRSSIWTFSSEPQAGYSSMTRDNFLGFGCSATTLLKDQFKINTFSVEEYCKRIDEGKLATSLTIRFTTRQRMIYYLFWTAYSTQVDQRDFEKFFGVPLKKMYGFELWLAKLLGFVTETDGVYRMTLKGAFYYHYYENFYTLAYIDKMWGIMREQAFPERIEL